MVPKSLRNGHASFDLYEAFLPPVITIYFIYAPDPGSDSLAYAISSCFLGSSNQFTINGFQTLVYEPPLSMLRAVRSRRTK